MQRAGELVEIKAFTGEKTLMNAVALFLHGLLFICGGIYRGRVYWGEKNLKIICENERMLYPLKNI